MHLQIALLFLKVDLLLLPAPSDPIAFFCHLLCGLPLFLQLGSFTFIIIYSVCHLSLLCTCPNHLLLHLLPACNIAAKHSVTPRAWWTRVLSAWKIKVIAHNSFFYWFAVTLTSKCGPQQHELSLQESKVELFPLIGQMSINRWIRVKD